MPIRVRWDIDFKGRTGRVKRIARRILEASPLFVELKIEGEKGLSEIPAIFAEIHKCNPRIEATIPLSPRYVSAARRGYPIDFLWEVGAREPFRRLLPPGAAAISFVPDEDNLQYLPDVLEEFADSETRTLHLPNINAVRALAAKGHVPIPGPNSLRDTARRISFLHIRPEGKEIVVHDYFLWRILREAFPGEVRGRVEYSGCQAGSALAHVDWDGNVYPCDSLPIRLGNLQDSSFGDIWRDPARSRILEAIRAVPSGCDPCDKIDTCRSGCRGHAYQTAGTLDAPDPSCSEKAIPAAK